jgi:hypothetical protein
MFYMNNFVIVNRANFQENAGAALRDRKTKFTSLIYSRMGEQSMEWFEKTV